MKKELIDLLTSRYQKMFFDEIKMPDNLKIILRDKNGRIKDSRNQ